ncbi:hypothetical protein Vadar_021237 [Vaccinium darrowii]|uniref:Uncharacterized protein n=1 Tax=Vaccinium darrowii TaxID=229202 RepID=A0ACB7XSF7_9ERIC|nr:hypothetical protein Vadar_021237 [Vaccinium darrowii]
MRRSKRKANQNAAATTISDLPNPVICDILSRLPLNSIFTCKRVCKVWRDLTLEPHFAKLHLSTFPLSLIFYRHGNDNNNSPSHFEILQLHDPPVLGHHNPPMKFRTEFYFPHMHIGKVASCNGLILLSNYPSKDLIIVCNPLTAHYFILPKPKLVRRTYRNYVGFGFGYSPATDQYKVLRYTHTLTPTRLFDIDIYTLGVDDEWRSLGDTAQPPVFYTSGLVFLNGALHWVGFENSKIICYFDIEKEQFGSFPLPSHIQNDCRYLGVVGNWLYIRSVGVLKFWMLKDYGDFGSWTLECVIEKPFAQGVGGFVEPLKILKDGTLLMMFAQTLDTKWPKEGLETTLASYNPQTRVLKKIKHHRMLGAPAAYVPCFFSPKNALK